MEPKKIFIAHDRNPVHRSKAVREYLNSNQIISELNWPPNFGDIMPMERIWDKMLEEPFEIQKWKKSALLDENILWEIILKRWNEVTQSSLHGNFNQKIIFDIQQKLKKVIYNNGGFAD